MILGHDLRLRAYAARFNLDDTFQPSVVEGSWLSWGDSELDKKWQDLVERTRLAFEEASIPFDASNMVKPSGILAAVLCLV